MKRLIFACLFAAVLCACSGVDGAFVKSVDRLYEPIYEDYKKLLKEKSGYDQDTIRIRLQAAEELKNLIEEAKK